MDKTVHTSPAGAQKDSKAKHHCKRFYYLCLPVLSFIIPYRTRFHHWEATTDRTSNPMLRTYLTANNTPMQHQVTRSQEWNLNRRCLQYRKNHRVLQDHCAIPLWGSEILPGHDTLNVFSWCIFRQFMTYLMPIVVAYCNSLTKCRCLDHECRCLDHEKYLANHSAFVMYLQGTWQMACSHVISSHIGFFFFIFFVISADYSNILDLAR